MTRNIRIAAITLATLTTFATSSHAAPALEGQINVNTATVEELDMLPGIGPVKAGRIVSHRAEVGGFKALEDLTDVSGIGPKTLAKITPHCVLTGDTTLHVALEK